jgi:hypothetical protein
MANKVTKDPASQDQPQVPCVYQYQKPPQLKPIDQTWGGQNVKPAVITDEHFDSQFVPPEIPDLNFGRKGRK